LPVIDEEIDLLIRVLGDDLAPLLEDAPEA